MNYNETIQFLYRKLPMFTRIGSAAYKADLKNTLLLCEFLGHPEQKFKSIHIAGTNGKGSCSHILASVFQAAGYKTGLYTSPHLIDFKERIKINGVEIDETWLIDFVERIDPILNEVDPSFFEVTVAMAFDYFSSQQIDIAIIETGLGGLLDSTNVIHPELSIITNISLDHTNLLGNSLQEIAKQKAGIIKKHTPVVIGEIHADTIDVFRHEATLKQSEIYFAESMFEVLEHYVEKEQRHITYLQKQRLEKINLSIDLLGLYQLKNVRTVLTALEVLQTLNWNINDEHIQVGLEHVKESTGLKGRFETIYQHPLVIADVAHNEAGLNEVFKQVNQLSYKKLHIVTGFVKDKDVEKSLSTFPTDAIYYFTQADIPRALPYQDLRLLANSIGLKGEAYSSIRSAIAMAFDTADKHDLILVTGSFFILEDIYKFIASKNSL